MNQQESLIKAVLLAWSANVKRLNTLFNELTEKELMAEIAPGKNRGIYLLGHLTAVNDRMIPLLGFGNRAYSHLDNAFIEHPDRTITDLPTLQELKSQWTAGNETLERHFNSLSPDQWLQRHTMVSEEDFIKEPHRNKFSVLLSRTNHLAYHWGQLVLLKK